MGGADYGEEIIKEPAAPMLTELRRVDDQRRG